MKLAGSGLLPVLVGVFGTLALATTSARAASVLNISTGWNNASSSVIPYGGADDNWTVSGPGLFGVVSADVVAPHPDWMQTDATSYRWISPVTPWDPLQSGGEYTYRYHFAASEIGANRLPSTLLLSWSAGTDNYLTSISLNGVVLQTFPTPHLESNGDTDDFAPFQSLYYTFAGAAPLLTADNTLAFTVRNNFFNPVNPSAFILQGTLQAGEAGAVVPLPPAVWAGLITLGGLIGLRIIRRRRAV